MTKPIFNKGDVVFVSDFPNYADPEEVYGHTGVVIGKWSAAGKTGYLVEIEVQDPEVVEETVDA